MGIMTYSNNESKIADIALHAKEAVYVINNNRNANQLENTLVAIKYASLHKYYYHHVDNMCSGEVFNTYCVDSEWNVEMYVHTNMGYFSYNLKEIIK